MMEAPSTQGRGGDTLVKKNTVLVVGGTGTLGRQVLAPHVFTALAELPCCTLRKFRRLSVGCTQLVLRKQRQA